MNTIDLKWSEVIPYKEACFDLQYPGVYAEFFPANQRVVYIGESSNIGWELYRYGAPYYEKGSKLYTTYNFDIKKVDAYDYVCSNIEESIKSNKIILSEDTAQFDDEEFYTTRKKNIDNALISAAFKEKKEDRKKAEAILQKYFIKKFSLKPYYKNYYLIGYTGQNKNKICDSIMNQFIKLDYFNDWDEEIIDYDFV